MAARLIFVASMICVSRLEISSRALKLACIRVSPQSSRPNRTAEKKLNCEFCSELLVTHASTLLKEYRQGDSSILVNPSEGPRDVRH
jgi:hypothetical protein